MKRGEWERYSDDDPTMNVYRMINGLVVLQRGEDEREGMVISARALPGGTFITLNDGAGEYPLDGPWMWDLVDYSPGEPMVGDTVRLKRKMTTVIGPVTRVDHHSDGISLHVVLYPAPLFVGQRHDTWRIDAVGKP